MRIHSNMKFFLPFIIITMILTSLFTSNKNQSIGTQQLTPTTTQKNIPSNPTPDNVQILGAEDIKTDTQINDTSEQDFDLQILYGLINSYRKDNGLNKLFINNILENSAQRKLSDMIKKNYFRHADSNNNESWYLFNAAGYNYKFAGENLSSGLNTPWQVFSAWQRSNAHNEQLLKSEYLDMGLALNCQVYEIRNKPACIVVLHLGVR